MPAFETMDLQQRAVLWEKTGQDEHNEPTVASPVEIPVRWHWKRRQVAGPNGLPIAVDVTVVVNQDVADGSLLWLGTLDDLPGTGTPYVPTSDVVQVLTRDWVPDIKARNVRRVLMCSRFNDSAPNVT